MHGGVQGGAAGAQGGPVLGAAGHGPHATGVGDEFTGSHEGALAHPAGGTQQDRLQAGLGGVAGHRHALHVSRLHVRAVVHKSPGTCLVARPQCRHERRDALLVCAVHVGPGHQQGLHDLCVAVGSCEEDDRLPRRVLCIRQRARRKQLHGCPRPAFAGADVQRRLSTAVQGIGVGARCQQLLHHAHGILLRQGQVQRQVAVRVLQHRLTAQLHQPGDEFRRLEQVQGVASVVVVQGGVGARLQTRLHAAIAWIPLRHSVVQWRAAVCIPHVRVGAASQHEGDDATHGTGTRRVQGRDAVRARGNVDVRAVTNEEGGVLTPPLLHGLQQWRHGSAPRAPNVNVRHEVDGIPHDFNVTIKQGSLWWRKREVGCSLERFSPSITAKCAGQGGLRSCRHARCEPCGCSTHLLLAQPTAHGWGGAALPLVPSSECARRKR